MFSSMQWSFSGFQLCENHFFMEGEKKLDNYLLLTLSESNKVTRRMNASGSPCPIDKISISPFKRCPYLRSYITELFRIIWQSGEIPCVWKRACTVLINKKGDTSEPATFRPITLESVPLNIVTSCICDSLFAFLTTNGFIEHKIQNGFLPKLSGTL